MRVGGTPWVVGAVLSAVVVAVPLAVTLAEAAIMTAPAATAISG